MEAGYRPVQMTARIVETGAAPASELIEIEVSASPTRAAVTYERDGENELMSRPPAQGCAALLASAKLSDRGHSTGDNVIQPPTTSRDCADQTRPALELFRTDFASRCIMREQDLAGSFGWWFLPGTCERPIIRGIGWFVSVFRFESNDQPVLVHNDPSNQLCDGAAIL